MKAQNELKFSDDLNTTGIQLSRLSEALLGDETEGPSQILKMISKQVFAISESIQE